MGEELNLIYGEKYCLASRFRDDRSGEWLNGVKGIYIGRNPVVTPYYLKSDFPEGHLFVVNMMGELKLFHTKREDAKIIWVSEDDETSFPLGIGVEEFEGCLRDVERDYLSKLTSRTGVN